MIVPNNLKPVEPPKSTFWQSVRNMPWGLILIGIGIYLYLLIQGD